MENEKQYGFINKRNRDYYGGGLMLLFGLGAIWEGTSYRIGSLVRMGPGFFPVALGVILALTGVAIMLGAVAANAAAASEPAEKEENLRPEWRGWICISLSIIAFVIFGQYGGLMPATFAVVFISALGDRQNTVKSAFILAIVMCILCVAIFWYALQVQFPLFQWG
ncbi:tripartite tricarboxylate transporter TctB family protein [Oxalobacteraceae bacterium CAVE-383]|nr:tripartite tricarboxylate transporter TctB family protein [Oxalobacteraceae bacterium CAVE-383]